MGYNDDPLGILGGKQSAQNSDPLGLLKQNNSPVKTYADQTLKLSDTPVSGNQQQQNNDINFNQLNAQHGKVAPTTEQNLASAGHEEMTQEKVDKRNEAIDNSLQRKYQQSGQKVNKTSAQYANDFNDMVDKIHSGDMVQVPAKDGKMFVVKSEGFLPSMGKSFIESFKAPIEGFKIMNMDGKELADYLDKKSQEQPYLEESSPSPFLGQLGTAAGGFPKVAGEFAINDAVPYLGTAIATADAEISASGNKTAELYQKNINAITGGKREPTNQERIDAANKAKKDAPITAAPEALMTTALGEMGADTKGLNDAANSFKTTLLKSGKSVGKFGILGGVSGGAESGIEKAQGYNVTMQDAIDNFGKSGFTYATMDAMFKLAPLVAKMPTAMQATWKNFMSKVPEQIRKEAIGDDLNKDVNEYKKANDVVPNHYSDEQKIALSHLISEKNKIKQESEKSDEAFKDDNDTRLENIDRNIQAVKNNPDNALNLVPDKETGEHNANAKPFDRLTAQEKDGIVVKKEFGDTDTKEIGEGEEKRYKPIAFYYENNGENFQIKHPIEVGDKAYTDKAKAQEVADKALKKHYYENGLHDFEKPQRKSSNTTTEAQPKEEEESIIQQQGVEGNKAGNEEAKIRSDNADFVRDMVDEHTVKENPLTFDEKDRIHSAINDYEDGKISGEELRDAMIKNGMNDEFIVNKVSEKLNAQPIEQKRLPQSETQSTVVSSDKDNSIVDENKPTETKEDNSIVANENIPRDFQDISKSSPSEENKQPSSILGSENKNVTLQSDESKSKNISAEENKSNENSSRPLDEKTVKQKLSELDEAEIVDPYDKALHYFANDGKIHSSAIEKLFGGKDKRFRQNASTENEKRSRIGLIKKDAPTIEGLAHKLWESDQTGKYDTQDYKNAIEEVLLGYNSKQAMAKDLVEKYDYDAAYQKFVEQNYPKELIDKADKVTDEMSDEELNHLLQLASDETHQKDLEDYIDNLQTKNNNNNAIQEHPAGEVLQRQQSENGSAGRERGRVESGKQGNEATKESKSSGEEEAPMTGIKHAATEERRNEFGLPEYERNNATDAELQAKADEAIKNGYNIENLVKKLEDKIPPTGVENLILRKYLSGLEADFRKTKSEKTLTEAQRVYDALDKIGSLQSEAFRTRKGLEPTDDTMLGFFTNERAVNNDAPLTENQKKVATEDFNRFQEAKAKFEEDRKKFEEEVTAFRAEQELAKTKKTTEKSTKKKHEDLVKEREQIFSDIKDKLRKARGQASATIFPYANELIAIAPDVLKLAKNLVEDGIVKLEEVIKNIHTQLDDDKITEKDVRDILAGVYNEKKLTKKEAAIQFENIKQKARLINNLEGALKGEPKTEKAKIKKNQDIEKFKKDLGIDKLEQLDAIKKRNETESEKIREKIKKGDFAIEEKKPQMLEDRELQKRFPERFKAAQQSQDELIKVKHDIALRRARQMYENKSDKEKTFEVISKSLNISRTLMTIGDFSAVFRQAAVATSAHPIIASKALRFMFEAAANEKIYNRWLDEVHNDPLWQAAEKSKLPITDPASLRTKEHEEAYYGAQYAEQIPGVGEVVKFSERAYNGYLNFIRWEMFKMYADEFENKGKTYENNPELYKGIASFIGSATGRGGMRFGESAAPVLNAFLFASRLIAARVNMLGITDIPNLAVRIATLGRHGIDYGFYSKLPKELRVKAAGDMLKFVGVGIATLVLAKQMGAQVELDPRSSDFGKIHDGNTRWDIWGGFQPYARLTSQIISGQSKSATTGQVYELDGSKYGSRTVGDQVGTFFRGKLAPVPAQITDYLTRRTLDQQTLDRRFDIPLYSADNPEQGHITLTDEMLRNITPLLANDVIDAIKDRGVSSLFTVGIPSLFGIGVQTYIPTPPKEKKSSSRSLNNSTKISSNSVSNYRK